MKKCPKCKAEIEDNARFCLYCMTSFEEKQIIKSQKENLNRWLYIIAAFLMLVIFVLCVFIFKQKSNQQKNALSTTNNTSTSQVNSTKPHTDESTLASYDKEPEVPLESNNHDNQQNIATDNTSTNNKPQNSSAIKSSTTKSSSNKKTTTATSSSSSVKSSSNNTSSKNTSSKNTTSTSSTTKTNTSTSSKSNTSSNNKSPSNKVSSITSKSESNIVSVPPTSTSIRPTSSVNQNSSTSSTTSNHSIVSSSSSTTASTPKDSSNNSTSTVQPEQPKYEYITATISNTYPTGYSPLYAPEDAIVITKIDYRAENGVYVIPERIDGKKVAAIMPTVFNDDIAQSVKTITLPATVRTIWSTAFSNCYNLADIYLKSANIGIYKDAFAEISKRNTQLTIHCSRNCMDFNYYYYRNIANQYNATYQEWNG